MEEVEMETEIESENLCFMDEESFNEEIEPLQHVRTSPPKRFTTEQVNCLKVYYEKGMTGTSKELMPVVAKAAEEAGLTVTQVKQWIKKRNFRMKHTRIQQQRLQQKLPVYKRRMLTSWHQFLKEYGQSEAGKEAMKRGTSVFSKEASWVYSQMSGTEKAEFFSNDRRGTIVSMKPKEVERAGAKIFARIQKLLDELESLGYRGLAVGFLEKTINTACTSNCKSCMTDKIVEYLGAITLVANPPPLIEALPSSDGSSEAPILSSIQSSFLSGLNSPLSPESEPSPAGVSLSSQSLPYFKGRYLSLAALPQVQAVSTADIVSSTSPTSASAQPQTTCSPAASTHLKIKTCSPSLTQLLSMTTAPLQTAAQPQTTTVTRTQTATQAQNTSRSQTTNQARTTARLQTPIRPQAITQTRNSTQLKAALTRTTTQPPNATQLETTTEPTTQLQTKTRSQDKTEAQTTTQLKTPQARTKTQPQNATQLGSTTEPIQDTTHRLQTHTHSEDKTRAQTATQSQTVSEVKTTTQQKTTSQAQKTKQTQRTSQAQKTTRPQTSSCLTSSSVVAHLLPTKSTSAGNPSFALSFSDAQITDSVLKAIQILLQKHSAAGKSKT